jgi:hypothetical protein
MPIDLTQFCIPSDYWDSVRLRSLGKPFRIGDKAYASEGRVIVEVEAGDTQANEWAPNSSAQKIMLGWTDGEWSRLPELPEPQTEECTTCCGSDGGCDDCHSTGLQPKTIVVQIGKRLIDAKLLRLIATLPGLLINEDGDPLSPMSFKFDGGRGLLMPMKPQVEPCQGPAPKPRRKRKTAKAT